MLSPRENFIRFFKGEACQWQPNCTDYLNFCPEEVAENVVRGFVQQQEAFDELSSGGRGYFGVDWVYDPVSHGAIEVAPVLDELEDWEENIPWPDLEKDIDWEGCLARNRDYLNTDKMLRTPIYSSFFERLISFVGFEDASIALLDEEQKDTVHKIFDRLADTYIDFMQRMHRNFGVELFELHDDWGTQRAPIFSPATHREMIMPYIKKVVDGAHAEGVFVEMHSCGAVGSLIPNLIETNVDTWCGQKDAVDKDALVAEYGAKFRFGVEIRPDTDMDAVAVSALCRDMFEQYRHANVWFFIIFPLLNEEQSRAVEKEICANRQADA